MPVISKFIVSIKLILQICIFDFYANYKIFFKTNVSAYVSHIFPIVSVNRSSTGANKIYKCIFCKTNCKIILHKGSFIDPGITEKYGKFYAKSIVA